MSTTSQTPETGIAIGINPSEQFHPSVARPMTAAGPLSAGFTEKAGTVGRDHYIELFRMGGIELSPEEFQEIRLFDEFLGRHVQQNQVCSVQCMLVWNEWVRNYRRQTHEFPKLILEKEFRSVLTDMFGAEIGEEDFRGAVFAGIRFVP